MNGKRPAEPGQVWVRKKVKKEVMAAFSNAVTEEALKKQVAEAWSGRTPFSHGNRVLLDLRPRGGSGSLCKASRTRSESWAAMQRIWEDFGDLRPSCLG
jgi:hypothetical protein